MKYTIEQFRKDYPNDAKCLDKLFQLRYGKLEACPSCAVTNPEWRRITTRKAYQCRHCYYQIYPTAGTIFQKSSTPLTYWFYAMYLMTVTRNGVSACELERTLGVSYRTAWRMARLIRELMGRNKRNKLFGTVEVDETYFGPKTGEPGRSSTKATVFAMVERLGDVVAMKVPNAQKATLFPIIDKVIDKSAKVMSDEFKTYVNLSKELGYVHKTIMHQLRRYVDGEISTNTVEGFFGQLKRMIKGTHLHVSGKYLQQYIDECVFRYNNRKNPADMFELILSHVV